MFKGAYTAIVTPFDENGKVNYDKLDELIEFQIQNKISGIVVCGTTGESSTLTDKEKAKIIYHTVRKVNKRVHVIAGTGSNDTTHTIKLSKIAQNAGVDGLLLVTPYYNKTSQEGLITHYTTIAKSVNIPCILYNVPSRTGINIEPETVAKLSHIPNIVGIKEASGNFSKLLQTFSLIPKEFAVFSGNDDMIVPLMSLGGSGVISVLSNVYPAEVQTICKACESYDFAYAKDLQIKYSKLINLLFADVNPMPIKTCMNILGMNVGKCRLPLVSSNNMVTEELKQLLL